jgi:hypothetical protein
MLWCPDLQYFKPNNFFHVGLVEELLLASESVIVGTVIKGYSCICHLPTLDRHLNVTGIFARFGKTDIG